MTSGVEWQEQVGRSWAMSYARTDRSFAEMTARFLEELADMPGETVLDIGCGAGELSLGMARQRTQARVVGLDISADLVAVARQRAATDLQMITAPEFVVGDAAEWDAADFTPDLLISRHGVMFFADPAAAFAHLRGLAAPQAQLAFTCFRAARLNPWASELAALLPKDFSAPAAPTAPGPFAFAEPARVENILHAAGWRNCQFEPVDFTYVAGVGSDPVADAAEFFTRIGPAARALRMLPEGERNGLNSRIRLWLEANQHGDQVSFPAAAWLVTAQCG